MADVDQEIGIGPHELMPDIAKTALKRCWTRLVADSTRYSAVGPEHSWDRRHHPRVGSLDSADPMSGMGRHPVAAPIFASSPPPRSCSTNDAQRDRALRTARASATRFDDMLLIKASTGPGLRAIVRQRCAPTRKPSVPAGRIRAHQDFRPPPESPCRCGDTGCLEGKSRGGWALVRTMQQQGHSVVHIRDPRRPSRSGGDPEGARADPGKVAGTSARVLGRRRQSAQPRSTGHRRGHVEGPTTFLWPVVRGNAVRQTQPPWLPASSRYLPSTHGDQFRRNRQRRNDLG